MLRSPPAFTFSKGSPDLAKNMNGKANYVNRAPVVSIPIAACLYFTMYSIMVKIDFVSLVQAGKRGKPMQKTKTALK